MNLEPLRTALLAETDREMQSRLEEVDAGCARVVQDAETRAHELATLGRLEGEAAAAKEAARRRATATRRAREIRLRAQRFQVEKLRKASHDAESRMREDSRYGPLVDHLSGLARSQLGSDAVVQIDPGGRGGVIGRKGMTSVDYTLPVLVDRAIASLDDELETLWQ